MNESITTTNLEIIATAYVIKSTDAIAILTKALFLLFFTIGE